MTGATRKPLTGVRILDLSALGPGPFATRIFADHGAEVVVVEPPSTEAADVQRFYGRGKKSMVVDLKAPGASDLIADLVEGFDVLVESMRPGKMEALGLGPDGLLKRFPRLIYLRLTCFGQYGPLADKAGHDINAIAIGGALALCGGGEKPVPPPTLLGDFASGSLLAVIGVLLALYERETSGRGQVIDSAMSDGAALLAGALLPMISHGLWSARGTNLFDGGAAYYDTYRCKDGGWMAVGSYERKFFLGLVRVLGVEDQVSAKDQFDPSKSDAIRTLFKDRFASKTRDEWERLFDEADVCVSPVVEPEDLANHPQHVARRSVFRDASGLHAGLAPRLSRADQTLSSTPPSKGAHGQETLFAAGFSQARIKAAIDQGLMIVTPNICA